MSKNKIFVIEVYRLKHHFESHLICKVYSQPPYQLELRRFSTENEIYFLQREA